MLHSKRARALIIALGLACAVILALVIAARVMALQVRILTNPTVMTIAASGTTSVALPLNKVVSISISETGGGSSGSAFIVAHWDATDWAWVGRNGNGSYTCSCGTKEIGRVMCTSVTGQTVKVKDLSGGVTFTAGGSPMRVLIHY
jgi:hypothetical protein